MSLTTTGALEGKGRRVEVKDIIKPISQVSQVISYLELLDHVKFIFIPGRLGGWSFEIFIRRDLYRFII